MSVKNDLILNFRHLFILCTFVGLSPYCTDKKGQVSLNHKSILQTLTVFLIHVIALILIYHIYGIRVGEHILKTIFSIQDALWGCLTLFVIVLEFANRWRLLLFLTVLQKCDEEVKDFLKSHQFKFGFTNIDKMLAKNLVLISCSIFVSVYMDYTVNFTFTWRSWGVIVPYVGFMATLPILVLKFLVFNFVVKERLEAVNFVLEKFRSKGIVHVSRKINIFIKNNINFTVICLGPKFTNR